MRNRPDESFLFCRAIAIPMRLAIDPPLTKSPPAPVLTPRICRIQSIVRRSSSTGAGVRAPDREIGVQRRSKQVRERRDGNPRRLHVAKHPRMRILPAKRNDRVAKNFQKRIKIGSLDWKSGVKPASNFV